jgi:predicted RNA binding protein YcfA (HicA-like mRNA interferase family)
MVKRRDLIGRIAGAAKAAELDWRLDREGGSHTVYRLDGLNVIVPRHGEVNERTASGIYRKCAVKLGKDWWRP